MAEGFQYALLRAVPSARLDDHGAWRRQVVSSLKPSIASSL